MNQEKKEENSKIKYENKGVWYTIMAMVMIQKVKAMIIIVLNAKEKNKFICFVKM